MNISNLMTAEVVTINTNQSIADTAKLMRSKNVGDIVVVETKNGGTKPVGIITDRDLVLEILAQDVDPLSVSIADIMTSNIQTITEDATILTTLRLLHDKGVRRAPIVDHKGDLTGVVSADDILGFLSSEFKNLAEIYTGRKC